MGTPMTAYAEQLADQLTAAGVPTVVDPKRISVRQLPVVLVAPPAIDYRTKEATWRLLVLGPGPGTLAGWTAIDELLDALNQQLPLETADPGTYTTPSGELACYVATFTTT